VPKIKIMDILFQHNGNGNDDADDDEFQGG
jgi:hypothetical protein